MRTLIAFAASVLLAGAALADEPRACYAAKDPSGDFTRDKLVPFDADPALAAEMRQLEGKYQRVTDKCIDRYARREGGLVKGAVVLYGGRISPEGKMTQVSVLGTENVNDGMFMACVARSLCEWEVKPSADGKERLVMLSPVSLRYIRNADGVQGSTAPAFQ